MLGSQFTVGKVLDGSDDGEVCTGGLDTDHVLFETLVAVSWGGAGDETRSGVCSAGGGGGDREDQGHDGHDGCGVEVHI